MGIVLATWFIFFLPTCKSTDDFGRPQRGLVTCRLHFVPLQNHHPSHSLQDSSLLDTAKSPNYSLCIQFLPCQTKFSHCDDLTNIQLIRNPLEKKKCALVENNPLPSPVIASAILQLCKLQVTHSNENIRHENHFLSGRHSTGFLPTPSYLITCRKTRLDAICTFISRSSVYKCESFSNSLLNPLHLQVPL